MDTVVTLAMWFAVCRSVSVIVNFFEKRDLVFVYVTGVLMCVSKFLPVEGYYLVFHAVAIHLAVQLLVKID